MSKNKVAISQIEYGALQQAYDFFNAELFDNSLPHVLITLQRHAGSRGYFHPEIFEARNGKDNAHELALNPDMFKGRTDKEIMSTLAHEMCHVWQQECGTPPRRCYHDKEWAAKMKEIGLQPSSTGLPGGKETGQSMTHYIIDGGRFDKAFAKLEEKGVRLNWNSKTAGMRGGKKASDSSKVKYTCPNCEQNAWAKATANLICGECYEADGEIVEMEGAA
jgi:predicted SprT family Zn-dependent metalloprotease